MKADEILRNHIGGLISPPFSYDRVEALGELEDHVFEVLVYVLMCLRY